MPDAEDVKNAELLVKHGFFTKGSWEKDLSKRASQVKKKGGDKILKDGEADMEVMEHRIGEFIRTSYPNPKTRHVLTIMDPNYSFLEKSYLWILDHVNTIFGFTKPIKIIDTYGSSVGTDHWQIMNDRARGMQRNISETLQTVGVLVKDMFPMIHEMMIWEERLKWHKLSDDGVPAGDKALKGVWTDVVEGGPENNGSIFGLARGAGFVTLPDLFFSTFARTPEEVDSVVDGLEHANTQVKSILKRKLVQFLTWRDNSKKEIEQRLRFTVRYLRQHISAIELQLSWLAPFLRQMKYLRQNADFQDDAAMISTFDTSKFEVETLCTKKNDNKFKPVVLMNFQYLSTPERAGQMYNYSSFQHSGSMTVTFRGYVWTDEQIESYRKMREEEAFELLGDLDSGFKAAMDSLGKEIKRYIEMAEGEVPESDDEKMISELKEKLKDYEEAEKGEKKKKKIDDSAGAIYQPFVDVGSAFFEIGKMFIPKTALNFKFGSDKEKFAKANAEKDQKSAAMAAVNVAIKNAFINYRKAHKMITW